MCVCACVSVCMCVCVCVGVCTPAASPAWHMPPALAGPSTPRITTCQRDFFIDNLLVRIHFIIVMIRWTGLAPWEFEFLFPGSLTSTFLYYLPHPPHSQARPRRGSPSATSPSI